MSFTDPSGHMATTEDPGIATGGCEIDGCATGESGYVPYSDTTNLAAAGALPVTYGAAAWSAPTPSSGPVATSSSTANSGGTAATQPAYVVERVNIGPVNIEHATVVATHEEFVGLGIGPSALPIGYTYSEGYLSAEMNPASFISGFTWGESLAFGKGMGVNHNFGGAAAYEDVVFGSPQASIGVSYAVSVRELSNRLRSLMTATGSFE